MFIFFLPQLGGVLLFIFLTIWYSLLRLDWCDLNNKMRGGYSDHLLACYRLPLVMKKRFFTFYNENIISFYTKFWVTIGGTKLNSCANFDPKHTVEPE
jgi:hypothetical protein